MCYKMLFCRLSKEIKKERRKHKKRFQNFDIYKKRTEKFEVLFNVLMAIRPTSIARDVVFSSAGIIKTKLCNDIKYDTFNALLYLKYIFLKFK